MNTIKNRKGLEAIKQSLSSTIKRRTEERKEILKKYENRPEHENPWKDKPFTPLLTDMLYDYSIWAEEGWRLRNGDNGYEIFNTNT